MYLSINRIPFILHHYLSTLSLIFYLFHWEVNQCKIESVYVIDERNWLCWSEFPDSVWISLPYPLCLGRPYRRTSRAGWSPPWPRWSREPRDASCWTGRRAWGWASCGTSTSSSISRRPWTNRTSNQPDRFVPSRFGSVSRRYTCLSHCTIG